MQQKGVALRVADDQVLEIGFSDQALKACGALRDSCRILDPTFGAFDARHHA
jgi:hypothetical protein